MSEFSVIKKFENEYAWLSNFAIQGNDFPLAYCRYHEMFIPIYSVEHAFQAIKASDQEGLMHVLASPTAFEAKKRGRRVTLREDWEEVKYDVMNGLIQAKFAPGTDLALKLQETFPAHIQEGNHWGDQTWGVLDTNVARPGKNWLGSILMNWRGTLIMGANGQCDPRVSWVQEPELETWHPLVP